MKNSFKTCLVLAVTFIISFLIFTLLVKTCDVQQLGESGTNVGFSHINSAFHSLTGVNLTLYLITDWLGLVPIVVCLYFGGLGLFQLVTRKNFIKVDCDILLLGVYCLLIIFCYIFFEEYSINYRPILIDGCMETSYPSSTTLLVLGVMPTLVFQSRRIKNILLKRVVVSLSVVFSVFMVGARLLSGVHWLTDIIGSVLLCVGLYYSYKTAVGYFERG